MALCMATSYGPQVTQVNEEPASESSLNLALTQHPHDENPNPREVCARLEVTPSSLVLSHFYKFSHLNDFVANRPRF
jgi:hypothetical protein